MSDITIRTNRHWRDFAYRSDVPTKILADQFDHLDADDTSDGFFQYRGYWYHVTDFMACDGMAELKEWHGYHGDSYFSGIVIRLSKDGERYMVGTYMS